MCPEPPSCSRAPLVSLKCPPPTSSSLPSLYLATGVGLSERCLCACHFLQTAACALVPSATCLMNSYAFCKALSSLSLPCAPARCRGLGPLARVPQALFPDHRCSPHLAGSPLPAELSSHRQAVTPPHLALRLAPGTHSQMLLPAQADPEPRATFGVELVDFVVWSLCLHFYTCVCCGSVPWK